MEQGDRPAFPRLDLIIPILLFALLVFFSVIALSVVKEPSNLLGPVLAAFVAIAALGTASIFSYQVDRRARISIAFEIARRWDEAPYLEAREQIRGRGSDEISTSRDKPKVKVALIHFTNLFWEIAVATRTHLAEEGYLKERFSLTLNTLYPALRAMLFVLEDRGALIALQAITDLHLRWNVVTPVPSIEEIRVRLNSCLSEFDKAAEAVPACNAGKPS